MSNGRRANHGSGTSSLSVRDLPRAGARIPVVVVVNSDLESEVRAVAHLDAEIDQVAGVTVMGTRHCPAEVGFTVPNIETGHRLVELLRLNDWDGIQKLLQEIG